MISILILFAPAWTKAQPPDAGTLEMEVYLDHAMESRIKGTDAEVSRTGSGIRASYSLFTFGYEYSHFAWDNIRDADLTSDGSTPWEGLHRFYTAAEATFPLNEDWMLFSRAAGSAAFEKEVSDSFGLSGTAVLIRHFQSRWSAGLGFVAGWHPVRSILVPAVSLGYGRPDDEGWSASIGIPWTVVRYGISESFALQGGIRYSSRIYRLKNSSRVSEGGYFRERSVRLGIHTEWKPLQNMTLSIGPFYEISRKWQLYNRREHRIASRDLKRAPGVTAGVVWRF